jgi:hypothetical protein
MGFETITDALMQACQLLDDYRKKIKAQHKVMNDATMEFGGNDAAQASRLNSRLGL